MPLTQTQGIEEVQNEMEILGESLNKKTTEKQREIEAVW